MLQIHRSLASVLRLHHSLFVKEFWRSKVNLMTHHRRASVVFSEVSEGAEDLVQLSKHFGDLFLLLLPVWDEEELLFKAFRLINNLSKLMVRLLQ